MNANATLNSEIEALLADINGSWAGIKSLPGQVEELRGELRDARRASLAAAQRRAGRPVGGVSDQCALALAGQFIILCERSGKLPALAENPRERDALLDVARNALGITTRAALTTTEIPLPQEFHGELRELISEFG